MFRAKSARPGHAGFHVEGNMARINVLIADLQKSCAFFLKSILARDGFGVSISVDRSEAIAKAETGLFDIMICDLDFSSDQSFDLIAEINDLLPGLPVIIATDWELRFPLRGLDVFAIVEKPIRISRLAEVMLRAKRAVTAIEDARCFHRMDVDLPVEVIAGGKRVLCKATNISSGGVQVESVPTDGRIRKMMGLSPAIKANNGYPMRTRIYFERHKPEEFHTRLAYVERFRLSSPEQVGLSFTNMSSEQKKALEGFLIEKSG